NNGKAKSHQMINLQVANPPNQVRASLERARKHSITWRLMEDKNHDENDGELPVVSYTIEYIRSKLLDAVDSSESDEDTVYNEKLRHAEEQVWKSHGSHVVRTKVPNNLYEISGLVQDAEYVFRFTAQNEAGSGDPLQLTAKTHSGNHEEYNSANTFSFSFGIAFLLSITWSFIIIM
uniref:Fibronectin type-III domain-containing protein n=1 Tax=Panagrolaimus sp. PS1159 TaxID=55785 RepID=A0AC35F0J8_9BILA